MIDILCGSTCQKTFPGVPVFIYGHSLGGGMVLDYLLRRKPEITGAIVTSPWLKLSFEPGKVKIAAGFPNEIYFAKPDTAFRSCSQITFHMTRMWLINITLILLFMIRSLSACSTVQ